jgi:hypothetical protein
LRRVPATPDIHSLVFLLDYVPMGFLKGARKALKRRGVKDAG